MGTSVSGLASGFDWESMIDQLVEVERAPQTRMYNEQSDIYEQKNALASISTQLSALQNRAETLSDVDLFDSRSSSVSDSDLASVTAETGTTLGNYKFNVTQLATSAVWRGQTNAGGKLSATSDLSAVKIGDANLATTIEKGTFTVNGKQITVESTDTLQSIFDKIATQTGNTVTASYDTATDKITLSSTSEIVLGSATDDSNFLSALKLSNNGTGSVTSSAELGAIRTSVSLSQANLATTVAASGAFKINGVSFTYNSSTDTIGDILARINDSDAGVTASYDSTNDRFVLANNTTGDIGIGVEDVSGNFLAATGLSSGTLERGKNLLYTLNGSGQLTSQTNVITGASSGVKGLSVTALSEGEFNVTVQADTDSIKSAIKSFVEAYNDVQELINSETASSTDSNGKVSASALAQDSSVREINSQLRSLFTSKVEGLTSSFSRLDDLGISSNGNDDSLDLSDLEDLDDLLSSNLNGLKAMFTKEGTGLSSRVFDYLDGVVGTDGSLVKHQDNLSQQITALDEQIADQEEWVQTQKEQMTAKFVAMETAQSKINQQLTYITSMFSS